MNNDKIKISIVGTDLMSWGGGIDFLIDYIKIFERHPEKYICEVMLPKKILIEVIMRKVLGKSEYIRNLDRITRCLQNECPNVKIVSYVDRRWRKERYRDVKKIALMGGTDILMPMTLIMDGVKSEEYVSVSYIYDFQHKHLPELFDEKELKRRDEYFSKILSYYDFAFTQSRDTLEDIRRYYGQIADQVYVMYAYPHEHKMVWNPAIKGKYKLSDKYFMICNQFWTHKNHKVAFEALEQMYNEGYKDVMIVCTGDTNDSRNPMYYPALQDYISTLNCRENIKILGYIDKMDQVQLLKGCISLIQPTLFEGNPGGGAVVDAQAYGVPCIVSDIPVNREIPSCYETVFFHPHESIDLAQRMKDAIDVYDPQKEYVSRSDYEAFYDEYDAVITDMISRKGK